MKNLKLIPLASLVALTTGSSLAQSLTNPDFEPPAEDVSDNGGAGYGPLSIWTRSGTNIGVNSSSQPFLNGQAAPSGSYVAFCQGTGSISQPVSGLDPAKLYSLSYLVSERGSAGGTATSTSVSLDGGTTSYTQAGNIVRTNKFRRVLSGPLAVSGASSTSQINAASVSGDNTLLIDAVTLSRAAPRVPDNGFENPVQPGTGASGFQLANNGGGGTLAGSLWTFTGTSGIMRNGSSFNPGAADYAPEGSQAALLISTYDFSTTVSGFEAGVSYSLSFAAKGRGDIYGPNVLQIELNGVVLNVSGSATVTPSQAGWTTYTTDPFIPGAGNFLLKVKGLSSGDKSTFIDDIRFNFVSEPVGPDLTPPTIVTRNPADNTTGVLANSNLVATFSEPVTAGTGNLILFDLTDNTTLATIAASDSSQVSISGSTLTLNPSSNLPYGKEIAVRMEANTVADAAANPFAGYSDDSWSFTVAPEDATAPTITTLSPSDDATRISPTISLVATFSENIAVGTGDILLKNLTNGTQTTIAVTDGSQVTVSGNQMILNPTGNYLSGGRNFAVRISSGAIVDQAVVPNAYAGIHDDTTWNFTTAPFQINNFVNGTDAATGISTGLTYTHLVDIQKDADTAVINGVAFNNTGSYTLTGTTANFAGNSVNGGAPGSGMSVLLDNFKYGGTAPVLTLSGLTPGQTYKLRLYVSGWTGSTETFTFDDTTPPTVVNGVDRGAWQAAPSSLDYTYTLAAGVTDLQVTVALEGASGSFHWFGFSNEVVPSTLDLASVSPADNAVGVDARSNLVASFNQDIIAGTGSITLHNVTDNTTIAIIAANDVSQVTFSGNTLTLNPASDLPIDKEIAVRMDPATVLKPDGSPYAGFNDNRWTFTTTAPFDNGTWIVNTGGNWSDATKWSGNLVANGVNGTATLDNVITAATGINLDGARTIGNLNVADTSHDYSLNGSTLTLDRTSGMPTIDVASGRTFTINNQVTGMDGLLKTGSGTLTLGNGTNSFSGDIVINAGAMDNLTAGTFGTGSNITFAGSGTISPQYGNSPVVAKGITVNPGATATLNVPNQFYAMTFSGAVSGSGTLAVICSDNGKGTVTLSSAANTFTGALLIGSAARGTTLNVNSFADGPNPIQIYRDTAGDSTPTPFALGAGTASSLVFNSRQIELMGTTTGATINNNNATATITINTPLKVTGVGNKTLTLGGGNSGANTFGGAIQDGTGSVISLTKAGAGTWTLSGANTHTGNTTVTGGTLVLSSSGSLTFKVTNTSTNKVTGAGAATLNGSFNIDTTAVTSGTGPWTLVDVATKSYGPSFSVNGFTGPDVNGLWKQVNGTQIWFFNPATGQLQLRGPAEIVAFGIPGSTGVIDQNLKTITLTVPYTPWGGSGLSTLAPTFTLSSGTCDQTSGSPPMPTFETSNPVHYVASDGAATNDYTVTVNVMAPATGTVMSNVYFPGHGYAWASDNTGSDPFSLLMVVSATTDVSAMAPTFTLSQFATADVPSGTPRDFTIPQTYTVTAEDGSSQVYTLTVQKITSTGTGTYQGKILASGPVSYWPLNEASDTTAVDLASGINPITYGGNYTLNNAGLRPDGNPSVNFISASAPGTATPGNPVPTSLNAKQFTVECWVKPNNTNAQYLVSLQDRSASVPSGGRWGYALWKNNGSTGFGVMGGNGGTSAGVSVNGATVAEVGKSYHVVGTYDGTTLKLYVNGKLEGSVALAYVPATQTQPGFTIGSRNGVTGDNSNIQDVAVYTRALTQAEIQAHTGYTLTYGGNANTGGTVPSAPVIGYSSGDTVTVLGNTGGLTRTGFDFSDWNTASNGSGTDYLPGDTFAIESDTVLYAKWTSTGYASWQTVNNAIGQTLDQDHDQDGVPNGIEYFTGGPNGSTTGFTTLPGVAEEGGGALSVTWTHAADYFGVYGADYVVEVSDTLGNWIPAPTGVTFPAAPANSVKYTFPAGSKNFARLKVTGP